MTMRVVQLCLRNRIAISHHQNSKHESLPTGCLLGLCLSPQATKTNGLIRAILKIRVPIKHTHPCSNQSINTTHSCPLSKTSGLYIIKV